MYILKQAVNAMSLKVQLLKGNGYDSINSLTPPHFCACPKARHGFPSTYAVEFAYLFNDLRWEVDVRLVVHVASCNLYLSDLSFSFVYIQGPCRGRDRMVVGFTTPYAIRVYYHLRYVFESRSWRVEFRYNIM